MALTVQKIAKNFQSKLGALAIFLGSQFLVRDAEFERAAEWLGTFERTPMHRTTKIWPWYQRYRQSAESASGQTAYNAAYERGSQLNMDAVTADAIAYIENH